MQNMRICVKFYNKKYEDMCKIDVEKIKDM